MNTKAFAVDGRAFDAGVVPILRDPAPADAPKPELADPYIPLLSNLFTEYLEKDSAESSECGSLLMRRTVLNEACARFVEKVRGPMRQKLIDEHETVKAEARKKQKEISDMRATAAEWQRELLKAKDAQARAMVTLRDTDQQRKSLSRFSPRSAFAKADEDMEAAEKRVDKTNAKVSELQQRINAIALTELPRLDRELNEIAGRETELDAQISGRGFTDSLGIVHGARAPL